VLSLARWCYGLKKVGNLSLDHQLADGTRLGLEAFCDELNFRLVAWTMSTKAPKVPFKPPSMIDPIVFTLQWRELDSSARYGGKRQAATWAAGNLALSPAPRNRSSRKCSSVVDHIHRYIDICIHWT
jgi:hypothetical protein